MKQKKIYQVIFFLNTFFLLANGNLHAQNTGIGTTNPLTKLHVYSGASGATPFSFSPLAVESNGHTYINLLCPSAYETAILFGLPGSSANGGILYNNVSTLNGFQFRTNGNVTRMVIDNAGNVGINNIIPSEKIDVAGNVRADNYKFSAPKTYHYSISGADFYPQKSTDTMLINIGSGGASMQNNVSGKRIFAPVHLPDGAAMTKMICYVYDISSTDNLRAIFYRKPLLSAVFPENIGTLTSTGASGTTIAYEAAVNSFSNSNIVDNSAYVYFIDMEPESSTGLWFTNMEIRSIIIEYTISVAQ